jgi:hypothetical protein
VSGFVWSRAEATASLGLKQPYVRFEERDVNMSMGPGESTWYVLDTPPLIPNQTHLVRFITDDLQGNCRAEISYTEQHTPRYYYYLTP